MEAVIYLITHRGTGRRYVGVTRFGIAKRWARHVYNATRPKTYLQRAIAKYGAAAFDVCQVASCLSVESAAEVEKDVIASMAPEFNQTAGGEFTKGRRTTPEVMSRIAASNRGKKRTPEQNAANSARKKALMADPIARAAATARLLNARAEIDEARRISAARAANAGRVWSDESRAKLSASCVGRRYGKEVIDRIRATKRKPVECIDLSCTFDSVSDAAAAMGLAISNVSQVCRGKRKTAGGMHFRFA